MLSSLASPAIQTNPFESTITVCSVSGPLRVKSRAAPGLTTLPCWSTSISSGPRTQHSAEAPEFAFGGQLDGEGGSAAIEEPDVIHLVDPDPHDLLHAPLVRQRLGPERVDAVLGRAVLVHFLSRDHLRVADAARGKRYNGTQNNEAAATWFLVTRSSALLLSIRPLPR